MLWRTGYILGLLFVLACALAYTLTWGQARWTEYDRDANRVSPTVSVTHGWLALQLNYVWLDVGSLKGAGFVSRSEPVPSDARYLYAVRVARGSTTIRTGLVMTSYVVAFPLWMPALATSLFMAWRWRRRRTRRGAGFPVADNRA
jgi:hypothetical protein